MEGGEVGLKNKYRSGATTARHVEMSVKR